MSDCHINLYQYAEYYDIAFDFRDVPKECDFFEEMARQHLGQSARSSVELCAGPASHTIELGRRGQQATALDLSPHMVEYGLAKGRRQGVELRYVRGDMHDFELDAPVDMALCLMSSIVYVLDNEAMLRHLASVARNLVAGGLYVLEMSHPRDVLNVGKSTRNEWTTEKDGKRITMLWGRPDDPHDPITQQTEVTVELHWEDSGDSGTVVDQYPQREFTANELRALVTASGHFEVAALYGSLDAAVPFDNAREAWRMVPVLRRLG